MLLPVCLTVAPEAAQVALGGQLAVLLTLQNTSDRESCYHFDVSGIPVDWYDLDQPRIALLPAASAQVLLTVHPRGGTVAAAGRYALTVQVTAEEDRAIQATAVVALTVSTASGVAMDVQPTDVAGRAATFRLTYHNHSPAPVAIALVAHDSEEGLRLRSEPADPVVVPVDRAVSIVVHVVPKGRKIVGRPRACTLVFRALQLWTVPQSTADLVREARFTYVPYVTPPALARLPVWVRRLPVWTGALALVLLALLLVLARSRTLATATRMAVMQTPAPTGGVSATAGSTPPGSVTTPPVATVTTTPTASSLPPAALLNPDAVDFGPQRVGTTSSVHRIYVVSVGNAPLTVTTVDITGPDPADFAEGDSCTGARIAMTGGCIIDVRFTPLTTGTRNATLLIVDNAPGSPQAVPLKGQR